VEGSMMGSTGRFRGCRKCRTGDVPVMPRKGGTNQYGSCTNPACPSNRRAKKEKKTSRAGK